MSTAAPTVLSDSYLTLHYRVSLADDGSDVISTFGGPPATLQLGAGQLAEPLERCLIGLPIGCRSGFDLPPEAAFGPRNPELLQRVSREMLDRNSGADADYAPGDLVEFPAPDGSRFAGVLKAIDADSALFDFNHPMAGRAVRFEVEIIGIL